MGTKKKKNNNKSTKAHSNKGADRKRFLLTQVSALTGRCIYSLKFDPKWPPSTPTTTPFATILMATADEHGHDRSLP